MPAAVPLAIVGSSLAGAAISSSAAKSAGKTQAAAANRATDTQLQMYGQTRDDLSPYRALGSPASSAYAKLLGLNDNQAGAGMDWDKYLNDYGDIQQGYNAFAAGGGDQASYAGVGSPQEYAARHYQLKGQQEGRRVQQAAPGSYVDPRQAALEATPGYQFARDQGIQSAQRAIGTRGLTGALAKGIGRFVTGLADQTYGANVDRLKAATEIGANAAAGGGQIGAQVGSNVANTITGAGQAIASGQVGSANAIAQGLSSIPSALLTNKILGGSGGIYGNSPNPTGITNFAKAA